MPKHKLSVQALALLLVIDEHTTWEGDERPGKVLTRYFVPHVDPMWCERLKTHISVRGSGDSAILRSLEHRGLIQRMKPEAKLGPERYYYRITEDGIAAIAEALSRA